MFFYFFFLITSCLYFTKLLICHLCIGLYLLPIKRNIKILISSYTSASSYDPIVTSYLLLFSIHGSPSFYKRDLLLRKIVSLILGAIVTCWGRSPLCQTLEIRVNYYLNAFWYVCMYKYDWQHHYFLLFYAPKQSQSQILLTINDANFHKIDNNNVYVFFM